MKPLYKCISQSSSLQNAKADLDLDLDWEGHFQHKHNKQENLSQLSSLYDQEDKEFE